MAAIDKSRCLVNRPGGLEITGRALEFCAFPPGARILDIGCGSGVTVEYLRHAMNLDAIGIDIYVDSERENHLKTASGEAVPYESLSFDGVLMECSFSLMENQADVLREIRRVLKPAGYLVISDLFAHQEPAELSGCLGRIDRKETIISSIENMGFQIMLFEDFTDSLRSLWGQMILEKGAEAFYCELGVNPEVFRRIRCGYFLMAAQKSSLL
jgi:ubiquinone/menaquinone biosynthesis C-methylase UbiE